MDPSLYEQAIKLSSRPYVERVTRDENETVNGQPTFLAESPELEGCTARGGTYAEAIRNLRALRLEIIYHLLENHLPVPGPYIVMV